MKREQKIWIILFVCYIASLSKTISDYFNTTEIELKTGFVMNQIIWPLAGSIICILVFPLLISTGFLKLKKKFWQNYEDSFIPLNEGALDVKKLVKRLIKIFLLTMGLSATLLGSGIIDPLWFTTATRISDYVTHGIQNPIYIPEVLIGFGFLLLPFVIGLWSIGWIFEDSGLMHYKFPLKEEVKFYEIEPVHYKYNALIESYAGISALLFYISTIIYI